ncbi:Putative auto-transporter adhesin, head GIN domain containing protein [Flavobacteriaceae bacterium]
MKNSIQIIVLSALFITTMANAQWSSNNRIKGNGKIITEKRTTLGYDEIDVSGFFDVNLIAGKEGEISIQGEENLMQYIKVEVTGNVLKIYTEKNVNISSNKEIILTVPFEQISYVSLSGSGDIKSKSTIESSKFSAKLSGSGDLNLDVKTIEFEANLSGSGDVVLTGNSDSFISKISGSGDVDAVNLATKNANLTISGSGDMKVNCSQSLYARVSGSGDIAYKGNPEIKDTKVSGSGEISKM